MARASCGVYENGRVELAFLNPDGSGYGTQVITDIETWRETNTQIESLAKSAGV